MRSSNVIVREALRHELAVYSLASYIRVARAGSGDYTQDRHRWLDNLTIQDVIAQLLPLSETHASESRSEAPGYCFVCGPLPRIASMRNWSLFCKSSASS